MVGLVLRGGREEEKATSKGDGRDKRGRKGREFPQNSR